MRPAKPPVPAYDCEWPSADVHAQAHITAGLPLLFAAIEFCPRKRRALQAGGCVGLHPLALAEHFAAVETWEPSTVNLPYLRRNIAGVRNITLHAAALSAQAGGHWAMQHFPANCGGSHLVPFVHDVVQVERGDDYGFDDVDLIQLDTEGHELLALQGLAETIARCRPVVQIEECGFGATRYGATAEAARQWLEALGYREVARSESDRVLVPT